MEDALGRVVVFCAVVAISGWLSMNPVVARAQPGDEVSIRPDWNGSWKPPEPNARGWDWIRLKSNEWIKGEIVLMRDFDLDFDSDEFGIVRLDWEDVAAILTEHVYTFVLQNMRTSYSGTMAMQGDRVSVNVGDKIESFDRSQLLAITPTAHRELNLWSGHASVGLGLRSGNTDSSDITGRMSLRREGMNTRFGIEYNGVYGTLDKQKNTNNHRARSNLDYFLTRDFFLTPAAFEVFTDEFQNISYRLTPTVGLGYFLVRRPALEWQVRFGGGYQYTRIDSAEPGDSKASDNGAILFGTSINTDLNSRVDLIIEYQLQLIAPDVDLTNHHSEVTFEVELSSIVDLDVNFVWDRIENPSTEAGGKSPKRNDFRISVGLALEF